MPLLPPSNLQRVPSGTDLRMLGIEINKVIEAVNTLCGIVRSHAQFNRPVNPPPHFPRGGERPGTVVIAHFFPGESVSDFFDTGTGLGLAGLRWDGWALCDSQNDSPDYRGKYPAGFDVADDDYDAPGNGQNTNGWDGFKWHGATENNHNDHNLVHEHDVSTSPSPTACAAAGSDVYAFATAPTFSNTAGCINWSGDESTPTKLNPVVSNTTNHLAKHIGPYNSNQDTDNRPPTNVSVFVVKLP